MNAKSGTTVGFGSVLGLIWDEGLAQGSGIGPGGGGGMWCEPPNRPVKSLPLGGAKGGV